MRKIITLALLLVALQATAQWSNTTNQFYDSLHMGVGIAVQSQRNPIVINSYPDGGYFVIWEDDRNYATTKTDIYAQKYDAAGNRLWADNGVPVVNGPNTQRYTFSSNQDYRNRNFAATDSAGGFYMTYVDDSTTNYNWERICVQHMRSDGTRVFGGPGYIIIYTASGFNHSYSVPMLIADGNKGFYVAYSRNSTGENQLFVYSYKDENGVMKNYGGGHVNEHAMQKSEVGPCGIRAYLSYQGTAVQDYNIWPDGQGGCNIIMAMSTNVRMLAYNRLWRAKKTTNVRTLFRNTSGIACPNITAYKKDDVYVLHKFDKNTIVTSCSDIYNNVYVVTSERLKSNGYQVIDNTGYDYYHPKGTTVNTTGNIAVNIFAATKRKYINNSVTDYTIDAYAYKIEKFDSIPYERTSHNDPDFGYNTREPGSINSLNFFRDTILGTGIYSPDFSLASGGNQIYAASLMSSGGPRFVYLQHLEVNRQNADSFAVQYGNAGKYGEVIGKEVSTGFGGSNIFYDLPQVKVDNTGTGFFYVREYYRSVRVSPLQNSTQLAWGAMGRPISVGSFNNFSYNLEQPVATLHPGNGSGIVAWKDNKFVPGNTGDNIFMRHIDSLAEPNYRLPYKQVKLVPNPFGSSFSNPAYLAGSSKAWSTLDIVSTFNNIQSTGPIAEIKDDHHLGRTELSVFQKTGTIRNYNGVPYLDRNYTIKTEFTPGNVSIGLRLFFTTQEFDALKVADNSISNPGDLVVIKQPNNTASGPNAYTPVTGEQLISPIAWQTVPGGFYIEIMVSGFASNFFIQKTGTAALCAGGNTSVSSSITGTVYQWQVNAGSGFVNIANSSNYTGTNTANLQLNNIPSSWYGYQYRCVVDGATSQVVVLRFSATWSGAVNTVWENPANWVCGVVPDGDTDVFINTGNVTLNSNVACRSLKITPGIVFTINPGFKLTITK